MTDPRYEALEKKYQALVEENRRLKAQLRAVTPDPEKLPVRPAGTALSPAGPLALTFHSAESDKIALFMDLFKGRSDVFARRWKSRKGKSGYSPACLNEWRPGVCGKPRVKCGVCNHAAYAPLTPAVIEGHLRGNIVAGIYPLNRDDTCFFLAMDFDKKEWETDIAVIRETCSQQGFFPAVERSRSGNGCHAWFFFKQRIPGTLARKFGTGILTSAMKKRHEIPFTSYDRLFPNQDTLPSGGFGNLIALPLQKIPRENGNSVFIDENMDPFTDQWAFLSRIKKLAPKDLNHFFSRLPPGDELGPLKIQPGPEKSGKIKPWKKGSVKLGPSDFPDQAQIVTSGMIYIEKTGFSPRALNRVKRLAAFKNPEFYKAQAMRVSTFGKPRIISCSVNFDHYLALPRGCERDLTQFLRENQVKQNLKDERLGGRSIQVAFNGTLYPDQQEALNALAVHENGVLAAATAFGKTVIGAGLVADKKVTTLVLVHRRQLLTQWRERLTQFLIINETLPEPPKKRGRKRKLEIIGYMGAGKDRLSSIVDVALMQSVNARGRVSQAVKNYGMIIVDECHHVPAVTVEQILRQAPARYIYGLTATPARPDGHHPIIFFYCGPVRYVVDARQQAAKRAFDHFLTPRFTAFRVPQKAGHRPLSIHDIKARLISDEIRNQLIIDDVLDACDKGRNSLVLTGRVAHVAALGEKLEKKMANVICLTGGKGEKETARVFDCIRSIPEDAPFVLVSTGSYVGEGFDEPRLDTLFLAMPISWKGTLHQYAGRLHRHREGKKDVQIYDYVDLHVPMLERMYAKRLRGYASMGYKVRGETFPGSPVNLIFNKDNFFPVYLRDIESAKFRVLIVSPFITPKRMEQMMESFRPLVKRQVEISLLTRPAADFHSPKRQALTTLFSEVQTQGVTMDFKSNIHQKFAIIDERTSWYGSINLLSFGFSEESIMRLESSSIAYELAGTVRTGS